MKETRDKIAPLAVAKANLKTLTTTQNPDATKWKIEEVVAHIRVIETLLNL